MKKALKIAFGIFVLVTLIGFVFGFVMLGSIVKAGVEKVGPMVTKVPVKLETASVSLFSGKGRLQGFEVGNPEGFKTPNAIKVGSVAVEVVPKSVLSDKVVVRSINVQAPEITYETDLKGNNLSKILENVQSVAGKSESAQTGSKQPTKLQVDEFVIAGGKINVSATIMGGQSATLPLPEIRLSNLGQGPEGITAAELTEKALTAIVNATLKVVAEGGVAAAKDAATKAATKVGTDVQKKAGEEGTKALQKVGDLFNKK
jgi:uncharacterized protein involved in outer membrane biogenesis